MAQRKKQRAARSKARKRTAAKKTAKPARKPAAKARPKRAAAPKKAARSKVRQVSPQTTVAAEIQTVDAFEEPVAEVEERGPDATPEPPDEKPS